MTRLRHDNPHEIYDDLATAVIEALPAVLISGLAANLERDEPDTPDSAVVHKLIYDGLLDQSD